MDPSSVNSFLDQFLAVANSGFGLIQGDVTYVLNALIVISIVLAGAQWALAQEAPLAAALANVARDMMTRKLAKTETSLSILFWSMLLSILITGASYPFGWTAIASIDWLWLVVAGLLNAIAHFAMIAAFRYADASALSPYRYSSLIWALVLGWLMWGHFPELLSLLGAAIIVGGAIMAARQR